MNQAEWEGVILNIFGKPVKTDNDDAQDFAMKLLSKRWYQLNPGLK